MGMLALAGAVSGAGQAVEKGLTNIQTSLLASQLQKERDQMELARQQTLQQQAFAHAETMQAGQQAHAEKLEAGRQTFELGRDETNKGSAIVLDSIKGQRESADKALDREQKGKEHAETMGASKAHYEAVQAHYNRMVKNDQDKITHMMSGDNGQQYGVKANGETVLLRNPETGEPIIGTKGLTEAAKAVGKSYGDQAAAVEKRIELGATNGLSASDLAPLRKEALELRRLERTSYGEKQAEPAAKPVLVDPDAPTGKTPEKKTSGLLASAGQGPSVSKLPQGAVPIESSSPTGQPASPAPPPPAPTSDMSAYLGSQGDVTVNPNAAMRTPALTPQQGMLAQAAPLNEQDLAPPGGTMDTTTPFNPGARPAPIDPATVSTPSQRPASTPAASPPARTYNEQDLAPPGGTMDTTTPFEPGARPAPIDPSQVSTLQGLRGSKPGATPAAPSAVSPQLIKMTKDQEGFSNSEYLDTKQKRTIGYGSNISDAPLSDQEQALLTKAGRDPQQVQQAHEQIMVGRLQKAAGEAERLFPWFDDLDPVRKDAVTSMVFNMGPGNQKKGASSFKRFSVAMASHDYQRAAEEAADSKWAREDVSPERVSTVTDMLRTGRYGGSQ